MPSRAQSTAESKSDAVLRGVCWVQGIYFLVTGIWPIVHIESFMDVTGIKFDIWLVKTVGALITVIAIVLLTGAWRRRISLEVVLLAVLSSAALAVVDVYYSSVVNRIPKIYLADAVPELIFIALWLVLYPRSSAALEGRRASP